MVRHGGAVAGRKKNNKPDTEKCAEFKASCFRQIYCLSGAGFAGAADVS